MSRLIKNVRVVPPNAVAEADPFTPTGVGENGGVRRHPIILKNNKNKIQLRRATQCLVSTRRIDLDALRPGGAPCSDAARARRAARGTVSLGLVCLPARKVDRRGARPGC